MYKLYAVDILCVNVAYVSYTIDLEIRTHVGMETFWLYFIGITNDECLQYEVPTYSMLHLIKKESQ
jgi:hypothetical protein